MDPETTILEAETAKGANREVAKAAAARAETGPSHRRVADGGAPPTAVYGICVVCHEKTPTTRLVALPATSLCLSCARKEQRWAAA